MLKLKNRSILRLTAGIKPYVKWQSMYQEHHDSNLSYNQPYTCILNQDSKISCSVHEKQ